MELIIPARAEKVYQGINASIRGREEKMFDGSIQPFQGVQMRDFVQIVAVQGDKIILTKEEQPWVGKFHGLIGGMVDDGYTAEEIAHKELKEEAGIVARDLQYIAKFPTPGKIQYVHIFLTKDFDGPGKQDLGPGEKIDLVSLTFDQFLEQMTQDDWRAGEFNLWASKNYFIHGKHEEFRKLLFG